MRWMKRKEGESLRDYDSRMQSTGHTVGIALAIAALCATLALYSIAGQP